MRPTFDLYDDSRPTQAIAAITAAMHGTEKWTNALFVKEISGTKEYNATDARVWLFHKVKYGVHLSNTVYVEQYVAVFHLSCGQNQARGA